MRLVWVNYSLYLSLHLKRKIPLGPFFEKVSSTHISIREDGKKNKNKQRTTMRMLHGMHR